MSTFGVVLSGCGVFDGSEVHEATLTLLAIDRLGHKAVCMAPNIPQMHVINHLSGEPTQDTRNVLEESARIARGNILDIAKVNTQELDAVIFVGGFGAAKNLSDFAVKGENCAVNADIEQLVNTIHEANKPLGFLCIAPAIAAKVLGKQGISITIGNDPATVQTLEKLGASHTPCPSSQCIEDHENKIITTPAYMLEASISEVAQGIDKTIKAVCAMIE